jgi:hypothetical protein
MAVLLPSEVDEISKLAVPACWDEACGRVSYRCKETLIVASRCASTRAEVTRAPGQMQALPWPRFCCAAPHRLACVRGLVDRTFAKDSRLRQVAVPSQICPAFVGGQHHSNVGIEWDNADRGENGSSLRLLR